MADCDLSGSVALGRLPAEFATLHCQIRSNPIDINLLQRSFIVILTLYRQPFVD